MLRRAMALVRDLPPTAFAFVMATGIVSVGLDLEGVTWASDALLVLALVGYLLLLAATVTRAVIAPHALRADLGDPARAFGFFTTVAAGNLLGARLLTQGAVVVPVVLLALGTLLWIVLGYLVPWRVVRDAGGSDLTARVDGTWFVWVVACQSVAILAASLQHHVLPGLLAVVAVLGWSTGLGLYLALGSALVVRVLRHGISAAGLGPAFWVVMGALAISVLAASRVVGMRATPLGDAVTQHAAGFAVVLWAFALWFVLPLLALGWWRHVRQRVPWHDGVGYWAMVFPLGMLAVASMGLGTADEIGVVHLFGRLFLWVAVVAWTVVTIGGATAFASRRMARMKA